MPSLAIITTTGEGKTVRRTKAKNRRKERKGKDALEKCGGSRQKESAPSDGKKKKGYSSRRRRKGQVHKLQIMPASQPLKRKKGGGEAFDPTCKKVSGHLSHATSKEKREKKGEVRIILSMGLGRGRNAPSKSRTRGEGERGSAVKKGKKEKRRREDTFDRPIGGVGKRKEKKKQIM